MATATGNGNSGWLTLQGTWVIASDVECGAYWEAIYYNISYVLDGGYYAYGQARYSYTIERETFALSSPQKTGYTFIGWTYEGQDTPVLDIFYSIIPYDYWYFYLAIPAILIYLMCWYLPVIIRSKKKNI